MYKYEEIAPIIAEHPFATVEKLMELTKSSSSTVARARALLGLRYSGAPTYHQDQVIEILKKDPKTSSYEIRDKTGIGPITVSIAAIRIGHRLRNRKGKTYQEVEDSVALLAESDGQTQASIAKSVGCSKTLVRRILRDKGLNDPFVRNNSPSMTDDEAKVLIEIYERSDGGPTVAAKHFGITKNAAIGRYHRYKKRICG